MIIGIGCDIIKISRIKTVIKKFGDKFIHRILTIVEVSQALKLNELKRINFYSKRFVAKEAVSKALGWGIGEKLSFKDIEIVNDANGKPHVILKNEFFKGVKVHLSITDERNVAIAYAIAEKQ